MGKEVSKIFDLHRHQLQNFPKEDCLAAKTGGSWKKYSTQKMFEMANNFSLGLIKMGIEPGDKVAIISENRPEWHITDLGILQAGAINVPIYPTITEEDYEYIFNDADVKMVLVSDRELLEKVQAVEDKVDSLHAIYTFNEISGHKHWSEIMDMDKGGDLKKVESIKNNTKEDDLATLIYTSGTTGMPKGVMLSHKNIVSNVLGCMDRLPVDEHSNALSFLPLCHVYERTVTYLYIYTGVSIYYAESMDTIGDNLKEVRPQVFTAVPRLLEKVYDKIIAKGKDLKGIKKALFFWAVKLGLKYDPRAKQGWWYSTQLKWANKLIFSKWREALGGRAKAVASGSAALQPRLARVFLAAGIPVMEGYGLTETSPVVAVNCEENNGVMIGSVGRPLYNVEVKIDTDGEILVKGPNVMMGYYNKPDQTKEVLDDDGWLHTGDIGELVEDNFLRITDRKKSIFKTSGGKYVAPQIMENKFKESPFIEQIMVIGEGEKHPAAIIQPAFDFLEEWCKRKGFGCNNYSEMIINPKVVERIGEEIEKYNADFAQYEKVKKFELVDVEWSIDNDELTPTLKLKRKIIMQKHRDLVEKIYRGGQE